MLYLKISRGKLLRQRIELCIHHSFSFLQLLLKSRGFVERKFYQIQNTEKQTKQTNAPYLQILSVQTFPIRLYLQMSHLVAWSEYKEYVIVSDQ